MNKDTENYKAMTTADINKPKTVRIASIDVFRALTMFLMIFVNDFWSVTGVPHWMQHALRDEDMLGLSDVVFPSFLFILGMSIPLAIENRLAKGDSKLQIVKHILIRSVALLILGVFIVNTEYGLANTIGMSKSVFVLLMVLGFFLIWNVYPKTREKNYIFLYRVLKLLGVTLLIFLALIFKDAEFQRFQTHWWGILGLIGWSYLGCALIYLFLRARFAYLALAGIAFVVFCIAGSGGWLGDFSLFFVPDRGCLHAFTMFGLLLSLVMGKSDKILSLRNKVLITTIAGVVFLALGAIAHQWWIVSKLQATPTWLFYCTGISILSYLFVYWLCDVVGKARWFGIIKPAGTATLTCYLIPYILYALISITGLVLPDVLTTGAVGLLKCVAVSLLCIGTTALLGKVGVKLKL